MQSIYKKLTTITELLAVKEKAKDSDRFNLPAIVFNAYVEEAKIKLKKKVK